MWICDPAFLSVKPIPALHKQVNGENVTIPDPGFRNRHMLVRRTFEAGRADRLELAVTADDYYKLYINGRQAGMGPAQAYHDRYNVNRYDLTPYLQEGRNVIAVHVFHMGVVNRAYQSGDRRQGLWFEVRDAAGEIRFRSDGACRMLLPEAWRDLGLTGYGTQFIEDVYGGLIPENWTGADFDDASWQNAVPHPEDDHVLTDQAAPPVEFYRQKPVLVERRGDCWFADMGTEVTGTAEVSARGRAGGTLELRLGEELDENGCVRYLTRCGCDYRLRWHLSGRETDTTDFFDYMAFRYIEVVDPENRVDPDGIRAVVRHYPMPPDAGLWRSGEKRLDAVWDICRRGVMLGTQEAFLDCPSREKGQYLGDGTITAHSHLLLTGDPRMYRKMLFDFAASARVCPGLMAVAPGAWMQEIADYSCQYPEQVLTYYRLTGDRETAEKLMTVVDGVEDYFDRFRREDGLIENVTEKWNLVDWPENLRDGYDFELSQPVGPGLHNCINAFYYGLKKTADELRALLGLPLRGEAENVRKAFLGVFRKEDGLLRDAAGSEHTALHSIMLPLYYGMIPPEDVPAAVRLIREKGFCCGVYMAYFLLKGLAGAGEYGLMCDMLLSEGEHSWINMLREGATACWEAWGKDQKWNTSLCHPWASAPIIILVEDALGLRCDDPSRGTFSLHPHAPEAWGDIRLQLRTVWGDLRITRTGGAWNLERA